ncbi:MAG: AAA family ATPase [Clostridia bacterium]|nr:AAA family ATPase [Clostridia bacterium]
MQGIGIGVSDFKILRVKENYFIDKSLFIKHILDNQSAIALITRPRRFGKTLNMSMLRHFLDCNQKDSRKLFEGLKIMEQGEKYTEKLGAYPCIYVTMKDVQGDNFEEMLYFFQTQLIELFMEHLQLLKSEKVLEIEKERFNTILNLKANKPQLQEAIKLLSRMLYVEHEKPVFIIIDEYDVPLQNAYVKGFYDDAIKFFRTFYGITFKDNQYMEKTVLTGVSRVAKESIFSGANNFDVYTVLDNEFSEDFGITSEEIDKVLKDFGIEENVEEIKRWYDGYKIGQTEGIYNPWSILKYLKQRELVPYWVNTSSNDLIKLILTRSSSVKERIERLMKGEAIEAKINLETIIVGIENNEDNIWGLLVGTGYLKVTEVVDLAESIYKVKIVNNEIRILFSQIIREWFSNKVIGNDLNSIMKDLVTLNLSEFKKKFQILVMQMFSYMDVGNDTAENFYHAFVLGMLVSLKDTYVVNSNRESGMGRYDIMLEPKDKNANSFIMEFKVLENMEEKTIEETIANAKKQIEDKQYETSLKERGFTNITKMVFAFDGKEVKIEEY